ncbi:MFS transporter [Streptomyces sp. NBC_01218]|uniref:MFS transporter n=1 Tax=unclassified Streptomyces TaxID=2593676 RepID=UPI0023B9AB43|nr:MULTISPECIES: MFS transporter [unclassified Streptomyces]WEH43676.1 MFS transporter [Streptomyces sp. AM 2-1-1]WSQ55318.1 MFS transporter [Streptomyces sp. NBC_01218]
MFLTGLAALAVVPTLPTAVRDLDGVSLFPLVAGCFVAASLLGGVLGGNWADRAGARRPLVAGMLLAVLTLLVSGASTSIWQLAVGRFLDGLAGGMVAVAVNAAIGQAYPGHLRARMLALMSACWVVPSLVGPPLAGLVAAWWSWRVVFLGLAAVTALPALAVMAALRRPPGAAAPVPAEGPAARPALLAATAVSLGAAFGQYGVSGWDPRHLLFAAGGGALLAVFASRLLPSGTWRAAHGLPASVLLRGLGSGVFFTLEAYVPLLLITTRDTPPVVTGLAFTGAALAWSGSSWMQARLLERVPRHRLVVAGTVLQAGAVVLAIVGTIPGTPVCIAASAMVVAALGMGMSAPSLTELSLGHAPAGREGYAGSAIQTTQNLGQITVLGLSAAVLNGFLGAGATEEAAYGAAFGLLLVPCALTALLAGRARSVTS